MTDRELLARKGHEVKDDLPDVVHIAREAVYASLMSTQDGTAETMAYADAYARAAVLAERERIAARWEAAHGFDKYGVAAAIRAETTKRPEPKPGA